MYSPTLAHNPKVKKRGTTQTPYQFQLLAVSSEGDPQPANERIVRAALITKPIGRNSRSKSSKLKCPDTLPLEAIYAVPAVAKYSGGHRYRNFRCGHNGKLFGGLYTLPEAERILSHFKGRRTRIDAREFGAVAERVIEWSNQQQGVAS